MLRSAPEFSWSDVDDALDRVEAGDMEGLAVVFLAYAGIPVAPDENGGRWGRVTLTSFCKHVGVPRHTLARWVAMEKARQAEETA